MDSDNNIISNILKNRLLIALIMKIGISLVPIIILLIVIIASFSLLLGLFDGNNSSNGLSMGATVCSYNVDGQSVSNIKIRLLSCEGNTPLADEELVDFEKYIIGVVYSEVGEISYEAMKVQAIAARSFALTRSKVMGGAYGVKMEKEGDNWIINLRSCTNDQVYCDPDKGCWSDRTGGQTDNNNSGDWKNCTVHSGQDSSKSWTRGPLSEDSDIRKAVNDTAGQVFVDTSGNIVKTGFTNTNQTKWEKLAKEGKDAYEILVSDYGQGNISNPTCTYSGYINGNISSAEVASIVKWDQSTAWSNLIGRSTTESKPDVSKSKMDSMVTTIEVPYRKWKDSGGSNPRTDTEKSTKKITVNKAIAPLWKAFFEDLYQNAPDFVIVSFDGCYYYKMGTGSDTLSAHAYGAACDINCNVNGNQYSYKPSMTKEKWEKLDNTRAKYSVVYRGSPVIQIAHKYTLINGSDWSGGGYDAMHFSFIRDWDRDSAIKCQNKLYC